MKTYILMLCMGISFMAYGQTKPIKISQKQVGMKVILIATNSSEKPYDFELSVTTSGITLDQELPLNGHLEPGESKEVLTLTGIPGQKPYFKYKLHPIPVGSEKDAPTIEMSRKVETSSTLIANSARHRKDHAILNVQENINPEIITVFTNKNCEACDELLMSLSQHDKGYQVINISDSDRNDQLMWDALYVFGRKEGRVRLPILMQHGKTYFSLSDLLEEEEK